MAAIVGSAGHRWDSRCSGRRHAGSGCCISAIVARSAAAVGATSWGRLPAHVSRRPVGQRLQQQVCQVSKGVPLPVLQVAHIDCGVHPLMMVVISAHKSRCHVHPYHRSTGVPNS